MTETSDRAPGSPEILVVGETLVDFLPSEPGPLADVETFSRRAGGAAANVAIGLARLDSAPWFLTNVAVDGFGDFLVDTLTANDVPSEFVARDPVHETTLAFVSHDAGGDRSFTFHGTDAADSYLDASAVTEDVLEGLSWVCVDAPVALAAETSREAVVDLCTRARERECSIAFDPNTRRELWPDEATFHDSLERLLSLTDVCKASTEDFEDTPFAAGTDGDREALAANVREVGPHSVFLTQGAGGASVYASTDAPWASGSRTQPSYDVSTIDTTGAGDAFLAGVLAALVDGEGIEATLAVANAAAALTTTEAGAIAALPDRAEVRALRESAASE